ncbi:TPA: helix-turn-helix domain-containing protein [Pseudomonas aeruginosa]
MMMVPIVGLVKAFVGTKLSIGRRIKEERERLGYTQGDFAELVNASRKSQMRWEQEGGPSPDAEALAIWSSEGVDVPYVLTGVRSSRGTNQHLPADEQVLLEAYRGLTASKRKELLAALLTGQSGKKLAKSGSVTVLGSGNRTAGRDYQEKE